MKINFIRNVLVLIVLLSVSSSAFAEFTLVGTHPRASLNWHGAGLPCSISGLMADGRAIRTLQAYEGSIYSGYGDWNCNTGPIYIYKLNPGTGVFTLEFIQETESIARFRVLNNKLYSVSIDPTEGRHIYAVKSNGIWLARTETQLTSIPGHAPVHLHDINFYDSSLWLFSDYWNGSFGNDPNGSQSARASRSDNDGVTWSSGLSLPNPPSSEAQYAKAFCFGEVFNGKLYVQEGRHDCGLVTESVSHVYDGSNWTPGPTLAPEGFGEYQAATRKTGNFAGKMVMIHASKLYTFDGVSTALPPLYQETIHDYTINGSFLYVLGKDYSVCRTNDLILFSCFEIAPSNAVSIEVLNDVVYVGTTLGKIYKSTALIPPPPCTENCAVKFIKYKKYLIPIKNN